MDYVVRVYNRIPDIKSDLFAIEICSRSIFEAAPETLINCHAWGCPVYALEPKLKKPEVKNY